MKAVIDEKIAMYELELARLMATPVFMDIQRLRGAIAALKELRGLSEAAPAGSEGSADQDVPGG